MILCPSLFVLQGSLTTNWLREFTDSLSAGKATPGTAAGVACSVHCLHVRRSFSLERHSMPCICAFFLIYSFITQLSCCI